ncbi:MAG: NHL repeat-containing protein, partial [Gemmatimonadales bacterium]
GASHAQLARATYVTEGSFQLPAKDQPGGLDRPIAIAVGPDGMIHVADERGVVQVFDAQGSPTRRYGQGQLEKPTAIAITREGHVFVLDRDRKQISVYDPAGQALRAISRQGNRGGELADPIDLAIGPAGYVYVLDKGRQGIQIFSWDGTFVREIAFAENIRDPLSLAVGRDGAIYVADKRIPTHLLILPPFTDIPWSAALPGSLIERVPIRGGRLGDPVATVVNVLGTAVILDEDAARLYRRNAAADDSLATSDLLYGGKGSGRGAFQEPVDVAFAAADEAVILDRRLRKVERIHLETEEGLAALPEFDFPIRVTQVPRRLSGTLLDIDYAPNGVPRLLLKMDKNIVQMVSAQVDRQATVYGDSVFAYTPDPQVGPQRQFTQEIGDVAAAALGDTMVIIADSRRDRFAIFHLEGGRPLGTYGDNYQDERRLNGPHGVALLPDGRIIIADTDNDRVKIFSSDLASLIAAYPVVKPAGVTVAPDGEIFVWNEDGTQAGHLDTNEGRLQPMAHGLLPARVAALDFDAAGNLFALDKDTHRVTVIEAGLGQILIQLGEEDVLDDPAALNVDRDGNIYLSDDEGLTLTYRWDVHFPPLSGLALEYEGDVAVLNWDATPERFTRAYEIQGANSLDEPFTVLATSVSPPYGINAAELPENPPRYVRVAPIFTNGVMGLATEAMPLSYFAATAAYQRGEYDAALREAAEGVRLVDEGVLTASEDVKGKLLRLAFASSYRLQDYSQAVDWAQQAARIPMPKGDLLEFLYTLADIYVRAGDPREASQQILTLVGQSPESEYYQRPEVRQQSFEIFNALRLEGFGREALEFMRAYAQSIPADAPDELRYEYEDSLTVFSARMKLSPGIEHWREANYGEVVSFFENLLTQGGLSAEEMVLSWQVLAAAYYAYGRRDQAEDTFRQIFALRPNFILSREIPRLDRLYGLNIYNPETRQYFGAIGPLP